MKILFVAIADMGLKGVFAKITATIDALQNSGAQVHGLIVSSDKQSEVKHGSIDIIGFSKNKKTIFQEIESFINANYQECPLIYFRYPLADKYLLEFVKKYGSRIVFEHNTIEENELQLYFKYYKLKDFLYNLRHFNFSDLLMNYRLLLNERKYGSKVLHLTKAGIGVTAEISEYENKRAGKMYCNQVIGNAVLSNLTPKIKNNIEKIENKLTCIFIAGHANNWHGIDRAICGIKNYKGKVKIRIIYVGTILHTVKEMVKSLDLAGSIDFVGICDREQIEQLILKSDIGISTLALHRIPLVQGSVLKTREYLLHGLPILIGYEDQEVERDELLSKYLVKVKANDEAIDFEKVINALNEISLSGITPAQISRKSCEEFGIKAKAAELKRIFEKINNADDIKI
ncbi:MAG: hypothetical protein Q8M29_17740 [Bacteroidota bacterium]|nr:hypothetical protein [Bacteroidota bacterium]